jgi:uncharacterized small protein (DUF1192 family)
MSKEDTTKQELLSLIEDMEERIVALEKEVKKLKDLKEAVDITPTKASKTFLKD